MATQTAPQPVKAYDLVNYHTFSTRRLEVQQNGQTILWLNTDAGFLSQPQINIQRDHEKGPIIAAAKLRKTSFGCRVFLDCPGATPHGQWQDVEASGWTSKQFVFQHGGRTFCWRRTHSAALGASSVGNGDFKLLDLANEGQVLAVHLRKAQAFNGGKVGELTYFADLEQGLELISLAAIVGVEEKIRRQRNVGVAGAVGAS